MNTAEPTEAAKRAQEKVLHDAFRKAKAGGTTALNEWLKTTPAHDANNALLRMAASFPPQRYFVFWPWMTPVIVVVSLINSVHSFRQHTELLHGLAAASWALLQGVLFVALWLFIWHGVLNSPSRSAKLLLAERGDLRVLPLLIAEWQHRPLRPQSDWNEKVSIALTQLLDQNTTGRIADVLLDDLYNLAEALLRPRSKATRDLTATQAYLAIAIVRSLHQTRGLGNIQLVAHVAGLPHHVTAPNRTLVSEVAQTLLLSSEPLLPPAEAVIPTLTAPTTQPAASTVQTLHRS